MKKTMKTLTAMANDHQGSDCMNLQQPPVREREGTIGGISDRTMYHLHLKKKCLSLAKCRLLPGTEAIQTYEACYSGSEICNRGEEDEGVRDGADPRKETVNNKNSKYADQAYGGTRPLRNL